MRVLKHTLQSVIFPKCQEGSKHPVLCHSGSPFVASSQGGSHTYLSIRRRSRAGPEAVTSSVRSVCRLHRGDAARLGSGLEYTAFAMSYPLASPSQLRPNPIPFLQPSTCGLVPFSSLPSITAVATPGLRWTPHFAVVTQYRCGQRRRA